MLSFIYSGMYKLKASGILQKIKSSLLSPIDLSSLAIFRIFFGLMLLWEVSRYFQYGWIERYYMEPSFHFTFDGFEWVRPWPGRGMVYHFYFLGACALAVTLGLFYRLFSVFLFLSFTYVFLLERARYLNHFYLICLLSFLMILLPAHHRFSIDKLINKNLSSLGGAWTLWTLRLQVFLVYFYGGVAKINTDWLQGEPIGTWLKGRTDFPLIGHLFVEEWATSLFVYGGLLIDLLIVPFILWRPTRWSALGIVTLFHLMNAKLFHIGIFPWMMIGISTLFLSPSWPQRLRNSLSSSLTSLNNVKPHAHDGPRSHLRLALPLLSLYFAIQVFLPLRHFLYPGNVSWTEEGHMFAWHMKLRSKVGLVEFMIRDRKSGREWIIDPERMLPYWQWKKMSAHPELIRQFAHHLGRKAKELGYPDVAVYAWAESALHHRPPQLLINPEVDLTQVRASLRPASWIVQLKH